MERAVARPTFDPARAEAFGEGLLRRYNDAAVTLMVSLGHRGGLFDALARLDPADSATIAEAAGLQERYVREWLGAMVCGGVVEHDPEAGTYHLPAEHAASLTRDTPAENLAVFAQYIPLLAGVEDEILDCFRHGGGVSYASYPRFHEVMAEDSAQTVLSSLEEGILPLVDGLVARLEDGIDVLDAGCGRGRALLWMAERFPCSRFQGLELDAGAVDDARREAFARGLDNVRFAAKDLSRFDEEAEPARFDLVTTFDAVHDQGRPRALLRGIRRALRPDGVYLMQDIHASGHVHGDRDHPLGPLLYTVSCLHCMTVSLAQGGEGLGAMWGRSKAEELLAEAGFSRVEVHRLEHDIMNDYYVVRP